MRIIKNIDEMRAYSQKKKNHGKTIGFIPTMGCLHDGHLSLVQAAKKQADIVVVSIFVNPIQFGPGEDLKANPKNLSNDKRLLNNFDIDVLFLPDTKKMFPQGFKTYLEVEEFSRKMCGRSRPNHFRGVTTIVAKLFCLVCPDFAFFGQKDFQQQLIIKTMVRDMDFPVEVVALPTVREFDGLAMSSRNRYLKPKERELATVLYKALCLAKEEIENGEKDLRKILIRMRSLIGTVPSIRLDYVVIADPETLEEVKAIKGKLLVALSGSIGKARLIDNLIVQAK